MIKHVLLLSTLMLTLPAMAVNKETVDDFIQCPTVKRMSIMTMSNAFDFGKTAAIDVSFSSVSKFPDSRVITSKVVTKYGDMVCDMEWETPVMGCFSELSYLSCSTAQQREEDRQRKEILRKSLESFREGFDAAQAQSTTTMTHP
jgi:hypothetical protein